MEWNAIADHLLSKAVSVYPVSSSILNLFVEQTVWSDFLLPLGYKIVFVLDVISFFVHYVLDDIFVWLISERLCLFYFPTRRPIIEQALIFFFS